MNLEKENVTFESTVCNFCDQEFHWTIIIEKLFDEKYPEYKKQAYWYKIPGATEYREKLNEDYYIYNSCIVYSWAYDDGSGQLAICKKHWIELFKLFNQ